MRSLFTLLFIVFSIVNISAFSLFKTNHKWSPTSSSSSIGKKLAVPIILSLSLVFPGGSFADVVVDDEIIVQEEKSLAEVWGGRLAKVTQLQSIASLVSPT